ncbi:hypothetical protein ABK040_001497 [Willaertia magna]
MCKYTTTLLFFFLLTLFTFIIKAEKVAFGNFACGTKRTNKCISATFEYILSSNSTSYTNTYTSYYDNNQKKVDLGVNLVIETNVLSTKARVYFDKDSRIIYNKYEHFEPGIGCSYMLPGGKCYQNETDEDNYVLCCVGGERGTGAFCLKEQDPPEMISKSSNYLRRAYQVYRMTNVEFLVSVQIKISQNGHSRVFTLSESVSSNTITDLLEAAMSWSINRNNDISKLSSFMSNNVLLRLIQKGSSKILPSEVFSVERTSNFMADRYSFISKANCVGTIGDVTNTHDTVDQLQDQFYKAEENIGIVKVLKDLYVKYPESITFDNTISSDQSGVNYFEIDLDTPVIALSLLIENIYEI